jgi:pyridoxine 5-phosphate synthase
LGLGIIKRLESQASMIKLGINIDHVATIRNARGGRYPCPLRAAEIAEANGADGITVHLREDRRHIKDHDLRDLRHRVSTRLNLEMANTPEMLASALLVRPDMVTLVPERRQELTTEGGLDVLASEASLKATITQLQNNGILASLFIDANPEQLHAAKRTGAKFIELHTGRYCDVFEANENPNEVLQSLHTAALLAMELDLGLNAGHGLHYGNVRPILDLPNLIELNIGHSLIAEAIFVGLGSSVSKMKQILVAHHGEALNTQEKEAYLSALS